MPSNNIRRKTPWTKVAFELPADTYRALLTEAAVSGSSKSQLIRQSVKLLLAVLHHQRKGLHFVFVDAEGKAAPGVTIIL